MFILKWLSALLAPEGTPQPTKASGAAGTYLSKADGSDDVMDAYYSTMDSLQRAISNREYRRAGGLGHPNRAGQPPNPTRREDLAGSLSAGVVGRGRSRGRLGSRQLCDEGGMGLRGRIRRSVEGQAVGGHAGVGR